VAFKEVAATFFWHFDPSDEVLWMVLLRPLDMLITPYGPYMNYFILVNHPERSSLRFCV
jgi:hypothetical protein